MAQHGVLRNSVVLMMEHRSAVWSGVRVLIGSSDSVLSFRGLRNIEQPTSISRPSRKLDSSAGLLPLSNKACCCVLAINW